MVQNKAFLYKSIPDGVPQAGKNIAVESTEFDLDSPAPDGGLMTKNLYATFDPAQRSNMHDLAIKSYRPAAVPGTPLVSFLILARVLKSNAQSFQGGDLVLMFSSATEEYSLVAAEKMSSVQLLKTTAGVPLTAYLGALSLTGLTAYGSLYELGNIKRGEIIVISAAAGAVGQIVGQIAAREGLTVIGSVGSDEKVDFITKDLGFSSGFNYKKEKIGDALNRLAPDGIDIYYDNVGGPLLDEALIRMKNYGRIIACGTVSQYNSKSGEEYGIKNYVWINRKRLRYEGFLVGDENIKQHMPKQIEEMTKWILEGSFKSVEHVIEGGMDNAVEGWLSMFRGENIGRTVLKIADP